MPRSFMVSKIFSARLTSVVIWLKTTLFARNLQKRLSFTSPSKAKFV